MNDIHIPDVQECRQMLAQFEREKREGTFEKNHMLRELRMLETDWQLLKAECQDMEKQIQEKKQEIASRFATENVS
eukprot:1138245-Pelagomonas_calceolata.AAC.16